MLVFFQIVTPDALSNKCVCVLLHTGVQRQAMNWNEGLRMLQCVDGLQLKVSYNLWKTPQLNINQPFDPEFCKVAQKAGSKKWSALHNTTSLPNYLEQGKARRCTESIVTDCTARPICPILNTLQCFAHYSLHLQKWSDQYIRAELIKVCCINCVREFSCF